MLAFMDATTTLPKTSMTLAQARTKLSGLHFAKEALSDNEREILYIAEGLLRLLDATAEERQVPAEIVELRDLVTKPGVNGVDLYADGAEVTGSPGDSDASAGFVKGEFSFDQVREAVGPHLPITDCR